MQTENLPPPSPLLSPRLLALLAKPCQSRRCHEFQSSHRGALSMRAQWTGARPVLLSQKWVYAWTHESPPKSQISQMCSDPFLCHCKRYAHETYTQQQISRISWHLNFMIICRGRLKTIFEIFLPRLPYQKLKCPEEVVKVIYEIIFAADEP